MKTRNYLILVILLFSSITKAQIGNYTFEQGKGKEITYKDYISGNYQPVGFTYSPINYIGVGNFRDSIFIFNNSINLQSPITLTGNGFPVGFKFLFDKDTITKVACSSNGYLKLGKQNENPFTIFRDTTTDNFLHPNTTIANYNKNTIISLFRDTSKNNIGGFYICDLGYSGFPGKRYFYYNSYYTLQNNINGKALRSIITLYENTNQIRIYRDSYYDTYNDTVITKAICGIIGNSGQINIQDAHFRKVKKNYTTFLNSERDYTHDTMMEVCKKTIYKTGYPDSVLYYQFSPPFSYKQPICEAADAYLIHNSKLDSNYVYAGSTVYILKNYYDDFGHVLKIGKNYGPYYAFLANKTNVIRNTSIGWFGGNPLDTTYTYDVFLDTDNPPVTKIGNNILQKSYLLDITPLAANTRYYYKVVAKNKIGNTNSCAANWFETGTRNTYCNSMVTFRDSAGFGIWLDGNQRGFRGFRSIKLGSINFTRGVINPEIYYFPEVAHYTTNLQRTKKYAIQVKQMFVSGSGSNPYGGAVVYIDMNRNGVFDSAEVLLKKTFNEDAPDRQIINDSIIIPDSIPLGKTTLRVSWVGSDAIYYSNTACLAYESFDFIVNITAQPKCDSFTIAPKITKVACYGQTNGKIELNIKGGTKPYNITWADIATNHDTTRIVKKGQYNCTITDNKGCQLWTDLIEVIQPSVLIADTIVTQPIIGTKGNIKVITTGGTAPYHYTWNTTNANDTFANLNNLDSGRYTVTIKDANGCTKTISNILIEKLISTGIINQQLAENISIYPNPTTDKVQIEITALQGKINYTIFDVTGRKLQTNELKHGYNTIRLDEFANGIYTLYIETEKGNYEQKVMVAK